MSLVAPCTSEVADRAPVSGPSYLRVVLSAVTVLGAVVLPALLTASSAVEMQHDLSFGDTGLGVAIAIFWISAALASTRAGRFADAVGGGRGVHLAGATTAASALGIALAGHTYMVVVVCLALAGAGLALAAPGMSALVSRQMQVDRQGSVLGFQQSGPPAASLLAGVALPVIGTTVGWRWSFVGAAALALIAVAFVRRDDCRTLGGQRARPPVDVGLTLGGALAGAVASAGLTFFVPLTQGRVLSPGQTGALLAVAGLVTIGVRVGLGLLADAGRADPMRDISALLAVGTVGFLLLASSANIAVTAGAVLGLGVGWGWGGLFVLCAMRRNPDAPGAAVGSAMRGIYAGAVIGPLIGGPLAATSPDVLWYSCAGLAAVGAAIFATQR